MGTFGPVAARLTLPTLCPDSQGDGLGQTYRTPEMVIVRSISLRPVVPFVLIHFMPKGVWMRCGHRRPGHLFCEGTRGMCTRARASNRLYIMLCLVFRRCRTLLRQRGSTRNEPGRRMLLVRSDVLHKYRVDAKPCGHGVLPRSCVFSSDAPGGPVRSSLWSWGTASICWNGASTWLYCCSNCCLPCSRWLSVSGLW